MAAVVGSLEIGGWERKGLVWRRGKPARRNDVLERMRVLGPGVLLCLSTPLVFLWDRFIWVLAPLLGIQFLRGVRLDRKRSRGTDGRSG